MARQIGAERFKEQRLAILDSLEADGIVITKHGQPIATLMPIETDSSALNGALAGRLKIQGDILSTGVRRDGYLASASPDGASARPCPATSTCGGIPRSSQSQRR
jgi:antitoxin (DNA-binding transcriptional repressor) of toxin-antitoxin stability system